MRRASLSDADRDRLSARLRSAVRPDGGEVEPLLRDCFRAVVAALPDEVLDLLLDLRSEPRGPGALLLQGFPVDDDLGPTPSAAEQASPLSSVLEHCLLGVTQVVGQPFGYALERKGALVHSLVPVAAEAEATSSESWAVSLPFHTDFDYHEIEPQGPFNVTNPDYVVLACARQDPDGAALTRYLEARRVCELIEPRTARVLREPRFQFAASFSFAGRSPAGRTWSTPTPILSGPDAAPEISIDLLCGTRALDTDGEQALDELGDVAERPGVADDVALEPGDILILDNRRGAHGRTPFPARFDGRDRWLHRVYARRSLWELRAHAGAGGRRVL